jgi:hypothetical protein
LYGFQDERSHVVLEGSYWAEPTKQQMSSDQALQVGEGLNGEAERCLPFTFLDALKLG